MHAEHILPAQGVAVWIALGHTDAIKITLQKRPSYF